MQFFNAVAAVAEAETHHPDLHLTNYRDVTVELSTHAVGGCGSGVLPCQSARAGAVTPRRTAADAAG